MKASPAAKLANLQYIGSGDGCGQTIQPIALQTVKYGRKSGEEACRISHVGS